MPSTQKFRIAIFFLLGPFFAVPRAIYHLSGGKAIFNADVKSAVQAWILASPKTLAAIDEQEEAVLRGFYLQLSARFYSFHEAEDRLTAIFKEILL